MQTTAILICCKRGTLVRAVVLCSVFLPQELVGRWFHSINFPSATFCRTDQSYDFQIWELRNIPALYPKANSAELYWRTLACHICVVPVHQNWRKGVVVIFQRKFYYMTFYEIPFLKCCKMSLRFLTIPGVFANHNGISWIDDDIHKSKLEKQIRLGVW